MAGNLTAMIASIFSGGVTPDPYYEYTTLLLPGNGTNGAQNNTFLDGSTNNFTITRNGNTTQGTFSPFSQTGWGNYFDGTSQYLTVPDSSVFNFGSGDFTIELFVYPTTTNLYGLVTKRASEAVTAPFYFGLNASTTPEFLASFDGSTWAVNFTSSIACTRNTWNHVAVTRNGSTFTIWVNGSSGGTATNSSAVMTNTSAVAINASSASGGRTSNGYISNCRLTKGRAVYTGAFTPPTAPLTRTTGGTNPPQGTECSLLTCQSNRFLDSNGVNTPASSPLTITLNGSPTVVAFSPFNPTASWSAATYGGSGYFDGSSDFLSFANNTALQLSNSTAYTIEALVYLNSLTADGGTAGPLILDCYNQSSPFQGYALGVGVGTVGSGNFEFWDGTAWNVMGAASVSQWLHVAISYEGSGTTRRFFINGKLQGSASTQPSTINYTSAATFRVGGRSGSNGVNGYISNLRIVKGTAVYTTDFTPPTAPLTAITNTSLLLNFTNAGIYDATSKNDLETVGNAKISTTQSKWGGSSISFDGTGDWLLIPDQPPQRIGTGNFTIEMWVYRNSSGTYGLAGKGTGTTGWLVSLNSSNQVVFTYGSSTITSSGTVSATTWTHIAVVREGTSTNQTKIYIGGTNDGTGTVSTDFNQTNSMYIGADRTGGSAANAYVQDVRITNYARYTANFTPPTAAFPTL